MLDIPEISIVMAVNRLDSFFYEAVESILNQTFKKFEFIIVVNGMDKEKIIRELKKYQKKIKE